MKTFIACVIAYLLVFVPCVAFGATVDYQRNADGSFTIYVNGDRYGYMSASDSDGNIRGNFGPEGISLKRDPDGKQVRGFFGRHFMHLILEDHGVVAGQVGKMPLQYVPRANGEFAISTGRFHASGQLDGKGGASFELD